MQSVKAAKLIGLSHIIAIQLHPIAESCTICSSRSRWPVRKLLDTPTYINTHISWRLHKTFTWLTDWLTVSCKMTPPPFMTSQFQFPHAVDGEYLVPCSSLWIELTTPPSQLHCSSWWGECVNCKLLFCKAKALLLWAYHIWHWQLFEFIIIRPVGAVRVCYLQLLFVTSLCVDLLMLCNDLWVALFLTSIMCKLEQLAVKTGFLINVQTM